MADGDFFGIGGGLLGNGGAGINPAQMGLLQGGLALMQSRPGEGFGGALGRAGQAGLQGYSAGLKQDEDRELKQLRAEYMQAQTKGLELTQEKNQRINTLMKKFFPDDPAAAMPSPQAPAQSGWVQPQQGDSGPAINGALSIPVQPPGLLGGAMGGQPQQAAPQQPPQGLLAGNMGGQPPAGLLGGMGGQQNPSIQVRPPMLQQMPQQQAPQQMPGAQQQGQQGMAPGNGLPFTLPQVMALQAAGGPDLLAAYKYANDGVERKAGTFYDNPVTGKREYIAKVGEGMNFNNGAVQTIPGYAESNAGIQGAQAAAIAGAQEKARLPYVGPAEAARQAAQYPYQVAGQINQASMDPLQVVGQNGDMQYSNRLAVTQPGLAGGQGGMPGQGMRAAINPVSQDAAKTINSDWITNSYRPTLESGKTAGDLSNSLQAFRGVDLNTGWGTEAKVQAASILGALGVKDAEKYAGEAQKFQAVAMDRLLNSLKEQKGPQTEGDSSRASKTFATLGNTPQANAFIADMAQAQANAQQRKAQFYEAALPLAQRDGDLTKVDREWRKVQGSIWNDPVLAPYARGR